MSQSPRDVLREALDGHIGNLTDDAGYNEATAKVVFDMILRDIFSALEAAGYAILPVEPTEAMLAANRVHTSGMVPDQAARATYKRMLAATRSEP